MFAGGDAVSGPASVVDAIAHGRRAAESIDTYLGGDGNISEKLASPDTLLGLPPLPVETGARPRLEIPVVKSNGRRTGFLPLERGYSRKAAVAEASRCLRCDVCK